VASEHRLFYCYYCDNGGAGKTVPVTWPDAALRDQIETLLAARPDHDNQNWLPSETAADLTAENVAHGAFG